MLRKMMVCAALAAAAWGFAAAPAAASGHHNGGINIHTGDVVNDVVDVRNVLNDLDVL